MSLRRWGIAMLTGLAALVNEAEAKDLVLLDGTVHNLTMQPNTVYQGTLPPGQVNKMMKDCIKYGSLPPNLIDNKYTILTGKIIWAKDSELWKVQGQDITSIGTLTSGNSLHDSIFRTSIMGNGLGLENGQVPVDNCIFSGYFSALRIPNFDGQDSQVHYNLFTDNRYGMDLYIGLFMTGGYNIFYKNTYNARITPEITKTSIPSH